MNQRPNGSEFVFVPIEVQVFGVACRLAMFRQRTVFRMLAELIIDQAHSDGMREGLPLEIKGNIPMGVFTRNPKRGP